VSQSLTFAGKFGFALVDRKNDLWRVEWDGRHDWYIAKDDACRVAISLAHNGEPPEGIVSLLELSRMKRAQ
jgi:hypothetical protein